MKKHGILAFSVLAACVVACLLQSPCLGQQTEDEVLLDFPKDLHPAGWRVEGDFLLLPVREITNLYTRSEKLDGMRLRPGETNPLAELEGGLYDIDMVADLSEAGQLVLDVRGRKLVLDVGDDGLAFGKLKVPDTRTLALRVVVDNTSTDVYFGQHGLYHVPSMHEPAREKGLGLAVSGGAATFRKLQVHELESIWDKEERTP